MEPAQLRRMLPSPTGPLEDRLERLWKEKRPKPPRTPSKIIWVHQRGVDVIPYWLSAFQQAQLPGPADRLAAGAGAQLAVDGDRVCLGGVRRNEQLGGDLGERQMGRQQRQQAQVARGQRRRPGAPGTTVPGRPGPAR